MKVSLLRAVLIGLVFASCRTPEGPRIPLPPQEAKVAPTGLTRVMFFNTSNRALYFESGWIRIRLDGRTVPTLWLNEYVQIFVQPGSHELLLEHYDVFSFTDTYRLEVAGREMLLEVWCRPFSTTFRQVDALPSNFATDFSAARKPAEWNAGE